MERWRWRWQWHWNEFIIRYATLAILTLFDLEVASTLRFASIHFDDNVFHTVSTQLLGQSTNIVATTILTEPGASTSTLPGTRTPGSMTCTGTSSISVTCTSVTTTTIGAGTFSLYWIGDVRTVIRCLYISMLLSLLTYMLCVCILDLPWSAKQRDRLRPSSANGFSEFDEVSTVNIGVPKILGTFDSAHSIAEIEARLRYDVCSRIECAPFIRWIWFAWPEVEWIAKCFPFGGSCRPCVSKIWRFLELIFSEHFQVTSWDWAVKEMAKPKPKLFCDILRTCVVGMVWLVLLRLYASLLLVIWLIKCCFCYTCIVWDFPRVKEIGQVRTCIEWVGDSIAPPSFDDLKVILKSLVALTAFVALCCLHAIVQCEKCIGILHWMKRVTREVGRGNSIDELSGILKATTHYSTYVSAIRLVIACMMILIASQEVDDGDDLAARRIWRDQVSIWFDIALPAVSVLVSFIGFAMQIRTRCKMYFEQMKFMITVIPEIEFVADKSDRVKIKRGIRDIFKRRAAVSRGDITQQQISTASPNRSQWAQRIVKSKHDLHTAILALDPISESVTLERQLDRIAELFKTLKVAGEDPGDNHVIDVDD